MDEFTGGSGTLQLFQDRLIDFAKGMALLIIVQLQLVDHVDDLTEKNTILHVVVGVGKGGLHDGLPDGRGGVHRQLFQRGEQGVVDEVQKLVARHGVTGPVIMRPIHPAAGSGNDGDIVLLVEFPFLFLAVIDFQKQHPCDLLDALGVAVDSGVIAHDIPQALYKAR